MLAMKNVSWEQNVALHLGWDLVRVKLQIYSVFNGAKIAVISDVDQVA